MAQAELFNDVIGRFYSESQAEFAYKLLSDAGFKTELLSIEKAKIDLKDSVEQSQSVKGAKGGALAGATLGGFIGLLVAIIINNLPETHDINPLLAALVSAGVWTVALSLIGAISGASVPKTLPGSDTEPRLHEYQLKVWGTPADLDQARATLAEKTS